MAKLSPHWINFHGYGLDIVAQWHSDWVKVLDPDPAQVVRLKEELGLKVLARLSGLHFGSYADSPQTVAENHWAVIRSHSCFPYVEFWESANEPAGLLEEENRLWLADYWLKLMDLAESDRKTLVWGQFSTGSPPGWENKAEPYWSDFNRILIRSGNRHILGVHEYWSDGGPARWAPWHVTRFRYLPRWTRIMVTECGYNTILANPSGYELGWAAVMSAEVYVKQLQEYMELVNSITTVEAIFVFTLDYASGHWATFDTRSISAMVGAVNDEYSGSVPMPLPTISHKEKDNVDYKRLTQELTEVRNELQAAYEQLNRLLDSLHNAGF